MQRGAEVCNFLFFIHYMQDIIPIFTSNFNNSRINSVNARDLHQFLEVKTKFATWVQRKIQKHRFIENIDFIRVSHTRETSTGGTVIVEYHFSTDMAKQISMLEDNKRGDEARLYFIQKEKQANNQPAQVKELQLRGWLEYMMFLKNQQNLINDL
jgi:anti-repressor protein